MLTQLYLRTTDPHLQFHELFYPQILFPLIASVVIHTIIYTSFVNMVSYIFTGRVLPSKSNQRLLTFLVPFMLVGFIGRFIYVKDIYRGYNGDEANTRAHIDKYFIQWVFLS